MCGQRRLQITSIAFPLECNIPAKPTNCLLVTVSKYRLRSTVDTQGDFKPYSKLSILAGGSDMVGMNVYESDGFRRCSIKEALH